MSIPFIELMQNLRLKDWFLWAAVSFPCVDRDREMCSGKHIDFLLVSVLDYFMHIKSLLTLKSHSEFCNFLLRKWYGIGAKFHRL